MPGWQSDLPELDEEWPTAAVEQPETPILNTFHSARSIKFSDTLNERPTVALRSAANTYRPTSTLVIKEDAPNNNNQLAHAAALLKGQADPNSNTEPGMRDMFTPLKLQTMFEAPKQAVAQPRQPSLELPSPPSPHDQSAFNSGDFTFSCPRPRNSWKKIPHFLGHQDRSLRRVQEEMAAVEHTPKQSTPTPQFESSEQSIQDKENISPSSTQQRSKLFNFNYDTYTRDHLEALVDQIDDLAMRPIPEIQQSQHNIGEDEEELAWQAYDQSDMDSTKPIPRASKRIRLSPDAEEHQPKRSSRRSMTTSSRSAVRDRIRERRGNSMHSGSAELQNVPDRIAFSEPMLQLIQAEEQKAQASFAGPSDVAQQQTPLRASNPITSRLAKAQALMDRIKSTAPVDRSGSTSIDEISSGSSPSSGSGSPPQMVALTPVQEVTEEEFQIIGQLPNALSPQKPTHSTFNQKASPQRLDLPSFGTIKSVSTTDTVKNASINTVLHVSERPQQTHAQAETKASAAEASMRNSLVESRSKQTGSNASVVSQMQKSSSRYFATAPMSASQMFHSASSLRQVSSSSNGRTGVESAPLSPKPTQPTQGTSVSRAGIVVIAPDAVKEMLQTSSGRMMYDSANHRWLKAPKERMAIPEALEDEASSEEDPFNGFESIEQSQRNQNPQIQSTSEHARVSADDDVPVPTEDICDPVAEHDTFDDTLEYDQSPLALFRAAHLSVEEAEKQDGVDSQVTQGQAKQTTAAEESASDYSRPRSALKSRTANGTGRQAETPVSASKDRRSVSFSDIIAAEASKASDSQLQHKSSGSNLRYELQPVLSGEEDTTAEETPSKTLGEIEGRSWPSLIIDDQAQPPQDASGTALNASLISTSLKPGRKRALRIKPRAKDRHPLQDSANGVANATFLTECSFSVSHDRLVQLITDVEPFEPSWEDLRTINLANRHVESLVRMKEFLPMLDEADLSNNAICYLTGVPAGIRTLLLANNALTSLTSFGHLRCLVKLDVSHNQLDSLSQFACLPHLRELRADFNEISSLGGLSEIDGLLKISLRGNQLQELDFAKIRWHHLESLDVSENKILSVFGLEALSACIDLNLDHNQLQTLDCKAVLPNLRILRACYNPLEAFDASPFVHLRTLFIDSARLSRIENLETLRKLESLSIRDQTGSKLPLPTPALRDIRRLYLSGNVLPSSFHANQYFDLTYLELAMCQITKLPANFSALVPNCRFLNLSYNFIEDLSPIKGLTRLRQLAVAGSRMTVCARVVDALADLQELELFDIRLNPLTLSFYPPLQHHSSDSASEHTHTDYRILRATTDLQPSWADLDARFQRNMPDVWYLKRIAYRSLLAQTCRHLKMIDGLTVESKVERRKIRLLLERAQQTEQTKHLFQS